MFAASSVLVNGRGASPHGQGRDEHPPPFLGRMGTHLLCGAASGTVSTTLLAPMERVKLILQTDAFRQQQLQHSVSAAAATAGSGSWANRMLTGQIALLLVRVQGWRSMWRGNGQNLMRAVPTSALRYCTQTALMDSWFPGADRNAFLPNLICGGLAGALALIPHYPFDLMRVKISTDQAWPPRYAGVLDCARQSLAEAKGSPQGLFRGMTVSLVEIMPYTAVFFGLYHSLMPNDPSQRTGTRSAAVGAFAGSCASMLSYPLDTVRRRLMLNPGAPSGLRGLRFGVAQILRADGLRGFYRGAGLNLLKSCPSSAISWFVYEKMHRLLTAN